MLSKDKTILILKKKSERQEIAEDDLMVSEISNKLFSNVITNFDLYIDLLINDENIDVPILKAKIKYVNHSSTKTIKYNNIFYEN